MRHLILAALSLLALLPLARAAEVNVALAGNGAIVVADSEWLGSPYVPGGERAAIVIDGKWIGPGDKSQSNRWHSRLDLPHPHWLWVKFRAPAKISRIVLHRADLICQPLDFVAEFSSDGGKTFQTVAAVTDSRLDKKTFTIERRIEPVIADNLRLRILRSSHETAPNSAQISELEVFGEFVESPPGDELSVQQTADAVEFKSRWLRLAVSRTAPRILALCWDSAGEGKVDDNLLKTDARGGGGLAIDPVFPLEPAPPAQVALEGNTIRYTVPQPGGKSAGFSVRVNPKGFDIETTFDVGEQVLRSPPGVRFAFAIEKTPVTLLANPSTSATAPLPALLHAPDFGTLLVQSDGPARTECEAIRSEPRWSATFITGDLKPREDRLYQLPRGQMMSKLRFELISATPPMLAGADELKLWPRYGLNAFQYRPDLGMLSNNIVSDNVIFCLQMYADNAAFTPDVGGISAMSMVRESLDRYFSGQPGYGATWSKLMSDVNPAAIIGAWNVIRTGGDTALLARWLGELERRADETIASDRNGNGLPESDRTGVRGSAVCPTSNWWDQVNFGHEDAYGCALAHRAFRCLADLERLANRPEPAARYDKFAQAIARAYFDNFYNSATGVLAGWKDAQGNLHDYYFTFVNGMAITQNLVPADRANAIMDRLQAKMKEVGFARYDLGLPGNLIAIPKDDYGKGALGSPQKEDGSDTFGVFENGGASACFAYYYIQALYQLGRRDEADAILSAMLKTYAAGGFQNGVGKGGEWRRWDGTPSGYEGYLPDAWFTLLALFHGREGVVMTPNGFEIAPWRKSKDRVQLTGLRFMGQPVSQTR